MTLHATTVALSGKSVLITGAAGAGKSALALEMMAAGASLVADDITLLWREGEQIVTDAPEAIRGRIEARGIGILNATPHGRARLALCIDLDRVEHDRLPPRRSRPLLGAEVPLLHNPGTGWFPAAVMQYLRGDRYA